MLRFSVIWSAVCFFFLASASAADFDKLLAKVPREANIVMLLNPEAIFASPLAVKEKWSEQYDQAFAAGLGHISPNVKRLALAAQFDLELKEPTWQVAAAEVKTPLSLAAFARDHRGALDNFDGTPAVALRNDCYLLAFAETDVALMSPANRQAIARWKRNTAAKSAPELSPFLTKAVAFADKDLLLQAIDLQDAIPPEVIRNWLKNAKSPGTVDRNVIAPILDSVEGATLQIRIHDQIVVRVVVTFGKDAKPLVPIAKPLLSEVLQSSGLALDDVANWKVEEAAGGIAFQGPLTKTSLRRLISLMEQPVADLSATQEKSPADIAAKTAAHDEAVKREATLKYFKALKTQMQDLKEDKDDAVTMGHIAQWMDYGAKQVSRTPQLDVDPAMLDFGEYLGSQLRAAAGCLRGIGINTGYRAASSSVATGYDGYSYPTDPEYRRDQKRGIQQEERAVGAAGARKIVAEVQGEVAKIRRAMTEKYRVEFK